MLETLTARSRELEDGAALLRKSGAIDAGIAQFCEAARVRFAKCADFASKRQFLLDYVEKVVHVKDKVALHGSVPIKSGRGEEAETSKREEAMTAADNKKREALARLADALVDDIPAATDEEIRRSCRRERRPCEGYRGHADVIRQDRRQRQESAPARGASRPRRQPQRASGPERRRYR